MVSLWHSASRIGLPDYNNNVQADNNYDRERGYYHHYGKAYDHYDRTDGNHFTVREGRVCAWKHYNDGSTGTMRREWRTMFRNVNKLYWYYDDSVSCGTSESSEDWS